VSGRGWRGWRGWPGRRWRHSLKARIVALFLLLALATSLAFVVGMRHLLQGGWQGYARPLVGDYLDRLAAELGSPPDPARAAALEQRLPILVHIDGPQVPWRAGGDTPRRAHSDWRERLDEWSPVRTSADGHRIRFALREPPAPLRPRVFGWITLAVLLGFTALAYFAVRRMLAPLAQIGAGVEAFGRGAFGAPIALARDDEFGELAARINGMAARLHGMLDAKRALLLAISHELRTPLTRARVNAELVAEGPARDALLRDLAAMRELITSLLESERLGEGHAALHAQPTDLAALVHEVLHEEGGAAELDVDGTLGRPVVDATRVRLVLRNLLANAWRAAGAGAPPPRVTLRREADGRLALAVRDYGPGLPEAELARLGEAFHRPDSARTREAGGVGLGLHLCRLVAQAHDGELRIRRAEPGLEVAMVWPG
jgi:signal transduction histidine kinase